MTRWKLLTLAAAALGTTGMAATSASAAGYVPNAAAQSVEETADVMLVGYQGPRYSDRYHRYRYYDDDRDFDVHFGLGLPFVGFDDPYVYDDGYGYGYGFDDDFDRGCTGRWRCGDPLRPADD